MRGVILTLVLAFIAVFPAAAGTPTLAATANDAEVQAIEARFKADTAAFEKAFDDFEKAAKFEQEFRYDLKPLANVLVASMRRGGTATARQTAAVHVPMMRDYLVALPPAVFVEVSRIAPPASPMWAKAPRSIGYEADSLPPAQARVFLNAMAAHNPDRANRGEALIALVKLELRARDMTAYAAAFRRLSAYKDIESLSFRISVLRPSNHLAIGKPAPQFSLPLISDATRTFSNRALAGKFYLIDIWATWCGPCLAERAALHHAYAKYRNHGFSIVSVSMDKEPAAVTAYRQRRWSMPWTNVFLAGGQNGEIAKKFDVDWIGLPRLALVDPQGIVVALQDDLGRDSLEATLQRLIGF